MTITGSQPELIYTTLTDVPILDVVHLASSERGLIAVAYNISTDVFLMKLVAEHQPALLSDKDGLSTARAQLREYLCGLRTQFSLPLDLNNLTDFHRLVLKTVACVPYGVTRSYGEIAAQIGSTRSSRAVGQANSRNPLPMVIPCHRIIAADGSLGGYSGADGPRTKLRLLSLEGVCL
ncbi:MAG: methylated-DNA--[protein]-cysteine S-methyltransferase [Anaerolineales bacterium]|nr:methylated-DNA--[protein]-cysteine S-methyltransferase [Anaerolineales bacterium]